MILSIKRINIQLSVSFLLFYSVFNEHLRNFRSLVEMMGFGRDADCASWSPSVANVHRKFAPYLLCSNPSGFGTTKVLFPLGISEIPWWRWWDSNPWPPACRAGALPAELHPQIILGILLFSILVGPSGLEPPTSCLSGTRSNLLSYEPLWLASDSIT